LIRFVTYVVVPATFAASLVHALAIPPRSSETYQISATSLISTCVDPAFRATGTASGNSVQSRSTRRAHSESIAELLVGKDRRGLEGNWIMSLPTVEVT